MEVQAIAKSVRMSPRKVRLVADMIRPLAIDEALAALAATSKRAALPLAKVINSAVANAVNNNGLDKKDLIIESLEVSESQALKRFHASTRGRTHPYKRRGSNIRIVLKTKEVKAVVKKDVTSPAVSKPESVEGVEIKKQEQARVNPIKKLLKRGGKS